MTIKSLFKQYLVKFKLLLRISIFRKRKMVFLFNSPFHPNMGDHAQTYCIQQWYKENYPEYEILILQSKVTTKSILRIIRKFIRKDDKLVCHSGYHLTDLYHEQLVYFNVIKMFKDYPIVILPQTINYTSADALNEATEVLNSHPHLTIMCRDERSFEIANNNFKNARILLYPDIVTSLIGTRNYRNDRDGVLFCMRNDIEAFYKPEEIKNLKKRFVGYKTGLTDTDRFDFSMKYLYKHRDEVLNMVIQGFSCYKVVITDRYHGTIFSLITGTPVVVIGTSDHKLESGVKWFPKEIFKDYVFFANNLNEAYSLTMNVLDNYDRINHQLPAYFKEKYFDSLKEVMSNNS